MLAPVELVSPNKDKNFPSFLNPFYCYEIFDGIRPYTLIELNMLKVLGMIKDKPSWYEKINDEAIRNRWIEEIRNQNILKHKSQLQYIVDELLHNSQFSNNQVCQSSIDGVWMSDYNINETLRQRLAALVAPIEANCTDFHPNSNEQVLDLVHPHMYPYVNALTREVFDETLPWAQFIGGGQIVPSRKLEQLNPVTGRSGFMTSDMMYSEKHQWLPSEVQVGETGKCQFLSYINNLHPREHAELYTVLEQILEKFIPLFNNVLTDLATVPVHKYADHAKASARTDRGLPRLPVTGVKRRERRHNPHMYALGQYWTLPPTEEAEDQGGESGEEEGEQEHQVVYRDISELKNDPNFDWNTLIPVMSHYDEDDSEFEENKVLSPSFQIIKPFEPPTGVAPVVDLKGSRLQVIVKLANIILTPEKPTYNGGSWHVEGTNSIHY